MSNQSLNRRRFLQTTSASLLATAGAQSGSSDDKKDPSPKGVMPSGKIAGMNVSCLISGSNLISMNMHSRDLPYVRDLARHYNTEERIFSTLQQCEEQGINAIVLKDHNFKQFRLSKYWDEWGGRMKWIADIITLEIKDYRQRVERHLELGASAAYIWGGSTDVWYYRKQYDRILKAYEIIRSFGVPTGITAHRIAPLKFCIKEGLKPDFFMKTLHHDRYWSAHPKKNRRYMEMYEKDSPHHDEYHDNMFCHDYDETIEFMQDLNIPWIAFKVLAAGAISPQDGIKNAFKHGADFICLGMFDFQVTEDSILTRQAIAEAQHRKRPWIAMA